VGVEEPPGNAVRRAPYRWHASIARRSGAVVAASGVRHRAGRSPGLAHYLVAHPPERGRRWLNGGRKREVADRGARWLHESAGITLRDELRREPEIRGVPGISTFLFSVPLGWSPSGS